MANTEETTGYDIAIVGMALRVPGANTPEAFWNNLRNGVESVEFYDEAELAERGVNPAQLKNPHYIRAGAPLDNMKGFDPEFFGFSPKEAGILDPQHRQFYECAWEALERSGHMPGSDQNAFDGAIGVFAGCGMGAYFAQNILTNQDLLDSVGLFLLRHTGNDKDFLSTRVSYSFDLKGPSVNVQTACSTSSVATHMACQSLISGECDMALAGGVTIELPHRVGYLYKEGEILSPDGHCRAFDHRSKGTIFGSGTGVIVLRRLEDALDDGDHIHAVISASAVNNDGSGKVGYLAPSVEGQAEAINEALAMADLSADDIDYVECHGTGTPVGDPIEVSALTQAFRESSERNGYCGIGSVKTNIGHLDTAAGVAGIIKAALAIEHGEIPPSLNYEAPNPTIDFDSSPFYVNDKLRPWPKKDGLRRAAVNSLGVGGTNAFVLLEQAPEPDPASEPARDCQLLVMSARNRKALDGASEKLANCFQTGANDSLADIAHTLFVGRKPFEHRRVLASGSLAEASRLLQDNDPRRVFTHIADEDDKSVVFMFPGGGAQYLNMGRDLYDTEAVFREHLDKGFELLKQRNGIDLKPLLFVDEADQQQAAIELQKPSIQLPAIFMVEYALAQLWISLGIEPKALIGHSMGENTAACVAGVLSFEDALGLVALRGKLMDGVPEGGMLSVPLSADELRPYLSDERLENKLELACINSPMLSIVSGPVHWLEQLSQILAADDVEAKRVPINIAAHSSMLDGILDVFGDYLKGIGLSKPQLPFVSNRTGTWITDEQATSPQYWVEHLRNTVLFAAGIDTLLEQPGRVFLEVGPGNILGSLTRQNSNAPAQRVFSSLRHPDEEVSDDAYFLTVLGRLWAVGVDVDKSSLWPDEHRHRVPLPTYAFQHKDYWIEPGKLADTSQRAFAQLEKIDNFEQWFSQPVWVQQGLMPSSQIEPSTYLVFADDGPVCQPLIARLQNAGHEVVTVREGDAYYQISPTEYRLSPEAGGEGYKALVNDLVASGKVPNRIVHLWLVTQDEVFRPGSSFFHRNQEYGFYSLFFLARALSEQGVADREIHMIVASSGMQQVQGEELPYPEKSTVLGPCKVIPREFPGVTCSSVDVLLPQAKSQRFTLLGNGEQGRDGEIENLAERLFAEAQAPATNGVFAYRNDSRWQQHYDHLPAKGAEAPASRVKQEGVYLITGGLGGIGFEMAKYLAVNANARLVLVNRKPLPAQEEWAQWLTTHPHDDAISVGIRRVKELQGSGAEVLALSADVTDVDGMRRVLTEAKEHFGSINGVIHAAGVVKDNLIPVKTQTEIEDVFAPKVYGTLILDELFRDEPLEFMVLFSSTSTAIAPVGQTDYVAANAFLNAYAQSRNSGSQYTVAINWGIWNEVGMAAATARDMGFAPQKAESHSESASHPLFEQRVAVIDGGQETQILLGHFSPKTDWFLDEHRTADGQAILPGTAYIELARAALAECGEQAPFEIRELMFFRALYIADEESRQVRVKLQKTERGYQFEVQSEQTQNDGAKGWQRHAQGAIVFKSVMQPQSVVLEDILARCNLQPGNNNAPAIRSRQQDHLDFGPRWHVIRQQAYGDNEAVAQLSLDSEYSSDLEHFKLHPALLDLATGHAMELISGYASGDKAENLWVPVSYGSFRYFRPLGDSLFSWVRTPRPVSVDDDFASFDVTLLDAAGQVLAEVSQLTIKRLEGKVDFSATESLSSEELELEPDASAASEVRQLSPAEMAFQHNLSQGILPAEGTRALSNILQSHSAPQVIVSSLDIEGLVEEAGAAAASLQADGDATKFARPDLDNDYVEARDEIERTLVGFWEELLGVDQVGVEDNFFDLGGHSLVAVRLFSKIQQTFDLDYPISVLFEAPTIAGCAEMIRQVIGDVPGSDSTEAKEPKHQTRYTHLVPMHSGKAGEKTPFFLVAGMFGNVLNLRHLAHLVGQDRAFYGLQARGLYGDHEPHETFEEMARDYIAEMKAVQPRGPYMLGGFSGGGITAFEMARQLMDQGEEVEKLILLDTPLPWMPALSSVDRVAIHWQKLKSKGPAYFAEWAVSRYKWELDKFRKRYDSPQETQTPTGDFQSERIAVAFYEALDRYDLKPLDLDIVLFRPKPEKAFDLPGGRVLKSDMRLAIHDNGWNDYVKSVEVHEVPGDHDGMVLEPSVRVLAAKFQQCLGA
ncbi:SDR family NAD(P)-dependent oxidoreductase [Porticoccus sp. W117]|uniref:type I polyketide synthase n=1 Tax=Porticoccus sp. W117 TaxID=3054777 RepID=UPI002597DF2D|nr:type I polyketide synthase [Porticoccus sp. W117]MDM3870606.1 SDR family NAD(P)-dependent oxidoreductase [Porticoccus sp. W117]